MQQRSTGALAAAAWRCSSGVLAAGDAGQTVWRAAPSAAGGDPPASASPQPDCASPRRHLQQRANLPWALWHADHESRRQQLSLHAAHEWPRFFSARALSTGTAFSNLPKHVTIYEVGPRDGLQNEAKQIPTDVKVKFIDMLSQSGLKIIEATSFVSPKWVPQLADAAKVMASIHRRPGVVYSVLTPNLQGFEAALKAGAQEVAIFAAASEAFSRKNLNCGVQESLRRFDDVARAAKQEGLRLRGYVSTAVHCPYSGAVDPKAAADVAVALDQMGCREVSMSDTTGAGTPASVARMFEETLKHLPAARLGAHMHDTYGQAVANILVALQLGVATVDSSVAGLGGCPYSPGASGNVATEDVVYLLEGLGITHGVDMEVLLDASEMICGAMGRTNASRAAKALLATRAAAAAAAARQGGATPA